MRLELPSPQEARHILRAFKSVSAVTSSVDERQTAMIRAANAILGADVDLDQLQPIAPQELSAALQRPAIRSQAVQGMVVLSLLDEEANDAELGLVEAFAAALDVAPDELRNLRQMVEGHTLALRFDVARRVWFMDRLKQAWQEGGFRWLARSVATLELMDDKPLAAKYRELADYPEGSLGRGYYDHMREQGFQLPGERGSQVEAVFIHDLTHLLSGYGTDARGEVLVASFSAGNRKKDPFTYIFFVLSQFHLGLKFSPFADAAKGAFDPTEALWAAKRGMEVTVDLTEDWDYGSDLRLALPEVRAKLGMQLPARPPSA